MRTDDVQLCNVSSSQVDYGFWHNFCKHSFVESLLGELRSTPSLVVFRQELKRFLFLLAFDYGMSACWASTAVRELVLYILLRLIFDIYIYIFNL